MLIDRGLTEGTSNPLVRGTMLVGMRTAALELFGEGGLAAIAAELPEPTRAASAFRDPKEEWHPDRYVIDWCDAVRRTVSAGDEGSYYAFIDRMMERGFGETRRMLLSLATPMALLRRAPELWRSEFTRGRLTYVPLELDRARVTLRDHVFTTTPLLRATLAEAFRHAVDLCRTSGAEASYTMDRRGGLEVILRWDVPLAPGEQRIARPLPAAS